VAGHEHRDLALPRRNRGAGRELVRLSDRLDDLAGPLATEVLDKPVVGEDLDLIVRERHERKRENKNFKKKINKKKTDGKTNNKENKNIKTDKTLKK